MTGVKIVERWLKHNGVDRVMVDSFGNLAMFSSGDQKIASAPTLEELGWQLLIPRGVIR